LKTQRLRMAVLGGCLLVTLVGVWATGDARTGRAVADSDAAQLVGGSCTGTTAYTTCQSCGISLCLSTSCPSGAGGLYSSGTDLNNTSGSKVCGTDFFCYNLYPDKLPCSSGT
jgi:hypothetical protein